MKNTKEVTIRSGSDVIGKVVSEIKSKKCTNTFILNDEDVMTAHLHTHSYLFDFQFGERASFVGNCCYFY